MGQESPYRLNVKQQVSLFAYSCWDELGHISCVCIQQKRWKSS